MATDASTIPRVADTGLERDDLTRAAQELGIDDHESLDDQELFERIGLQLGEISEEQLEGSADEAQGTAEGAADATEDQAQDAAEDATDEVEDTADEAEDTAEDARDEAEDARDEAEDTAEDARDEAEDTAEDATDEAEDTAEDATDEAEDTAEQGQPDEYRPEDDDRPGVASLLDLELGPVALDLLGLEVHLNRIHAVITANPVPNYAVLGKLLAKLGTPLKALGIDKVTDAATGVVDKTLDAVPSPDTSTDDAEDEGPSEDSDDGLLSTIAAPFRAAFRGAKHLASDPQEVAEIAEDAKDAGTRGAAAVGKAASGSKLGALRDGRRAVAHAKDAVRHSADMARPSA